ncbi:Metallo-peptidase family M12B Reprolysin-like-domain-containing protein [Cladochytrium replicatum]|nr:Metallo-peptidase family M12B Reprolysin-like-domain-containing protein [Cladochytrium replicatum]
MNSPLVFILSLLVCLATSVSSLSHHNPNPVRYYDFISTSHVEYNNHGALVLHFNAFNQTFKLQLKKNTLLLHPEAVITTTDIDDEGNEVFSETPVGDFGTYHGDVVEPERGWAGITFQNLNILTYDKNDILVFEGSFTAGDMMFHIHDIATYQRVKQEFDVNIASPLSRPTAHRRSKMIIFTDQSKEFLAALNSEELRPTGNLALRRRDDTAVFGSCGTMTPEGQGVIVGKILSQNVNSLTESNNLFGNLPANGGSGNPTDGCPSSLKVLFMSAAADCTYVTAHGGVTPAAQQILKNWNTASAIYQNAMNIGLTLINVTLKRVCTPNDENLKWNQDCSTGYNLTQRLSDFSKWRGTVTDQAGLWHLVTKCGTGSAVGLAWVGSLCTTTAKAQTQDGVKTYSSGTGVSVITTNEWKVVAHEIAHNFGAIHDCNTNMCSPSCTSSSCACCPCTNCDCAGKYLMHPSDNAESNEFSPCSIRYICSNYTNTAKCLKNPNEITAFKAGVCGNGIKEDGEECDCGTSEQCAKDACCNGNTCKLKTGAVCSDSNDECCSGCQLRDAGHVCRASSGPCDLEETCSGTNATCPIDLVMKDGTTCTDAFGGNVCASGYCTSRNSQCLNSMFGTVSQCDGSELQCTLHCKTSDGTCLNLNQNYIDGTPCGYGFGGTCRDGVCKTGSGVVDAIYSFFQLFQSYGIAIVVIAALLVLALILLIVRCCIRRRAASKQLSDDPKKNPLRGGKSESMLKNPFFQKSHQGKDLDSSAPRVPEMAKVNSERTDVATDNSSRRTPPQQQQQQNYQPYNARAYDDGYGRQGSPRAGNAPSPRVGNASSPAPYESRYSADMNGVYGDREVGSPLVGNAMLQGEREGRQGGQRGERSRSRAPPPQGKRR